MTLRIGAVLTHPIQYYSPWFRHVAQRCDFTAYYAHRQSADGQASAGFGVRFEWDVPLLEGYDWRWLANVSARPGLDRFDGCDTPEIATIVARGGFDALMMFGWNKKCFLQAGWAALRSGTPLLVRLDSQLRTSISTMKKLAKRPLYSAILPRAAHYLSPGKRTDAYLRHFGVGDARIHRLAHMIDATRFRTEARASRADGRARALRAAHGAGEADFVFLFVAKLIPKKRPLLLLDALARLRADDPDAFARTRLWIVGDGPMRGEIEARVRAESLPARLLGFVNQRELPAAYAAGDCLVLPSDGDETWGLVVNEAFACGLPAIVSDDAGCSPDLIEPGVTGWILDRPAPEALAGLLATAIRRAPKLPPAPRDARSREGSFEHGATRLMEIVSGLPSDRRKRLASATGARPSAADAP